MSGILNGRARSNEARSNQIGRSVDFSSVFSSSFKLLQHASMTVTQQMLQLSEHCSVHEQGLDAEG